MSKIKILGIETSFDNTCCGVITMDKNCKWESLDEYNYTQDHSKNGGVIPNLSTEEHLKILPNMVKNILIKHPDISIIAATVTPGLIGNLLINEYFSLTIAKYTNRIFIPVNHLEGHILVTNQTFPYLALLLSGGHSLIIAVYEYNKYEVIFKCLDDSAGECMDKVARYIGLEYPYGVNVEKVILNSGTRTYDYFPTLLKTYDFSFSGLKTKLINLYDKGVSQLEICNLLENTLIAMVINKLKKAQKKTGISKIVACGGVASNYFLREKLKELNVYFPPKNLCIDNGTMIAVAGGYYHINKNKRLIKTIATNDFFL